MMHGPGIEHHDGVLGDKLPTVGKVFAGDMRCSEPKRVVAAFDLRRILCELNALHCQLLLKTYFFDNGVAVWQTLLVLDRR